MKTAHKTKTKLLSWILTIVIIFTTIPMSLLTVCAQGIDNVVTALTENTTEFLGGNGTEKNPYLISNKTHLNNVRKYLDAHFKMMADIEFTDADFAEGGEFYNNGQGWEPIGKNVNSPFTGVFDGDGHIISSLFLFQYDAGGLGLFGDLIGGTIKNLTVSNSTMSIMSKTGGILDASERKAGFIVGQVFFDAKQPSYVLNCKSINNHMKTTSLGNYGGVVGYAGDIYNRDDEQSMPIVISGCVNRSDIVISSAHILSAGGIIGECSSLSDSDILVQQCVNQGKIIIRKDSSGILYAGGVLGNLLIRQKGNITVSNCYNSAEISAPYTAGGLIAQMYSDGLGKGILENSYTALGVGVAEIKGSIDVLHITHCYAPIASYDITSLTVSQMREMTSFVGFDFDTVWTMEGNEDYLYPELQSVLMQFEKKLDSIAVSAPPAKTEYLEGKDKLDVTGGKLTLTYNNGTTEVIDLTKNMVSGFNNTEVGKQTLTVTYKDKSTTFDVEVVAKSLESIEVSTLPTKLEYLESKDTLDVTGGKLTLTYNNGTTEVIDLTADMVTGFDNTQIGSQILTVTYKGKTATFKVEVVAKSLTEIKVTQKPDKLSYLEGDAFNPAGMEVVAYYNNGTSEKIINYEISGYNATPGDKVITIRYQDKTATFKVTVTAKSLTGIQITKQPNKTTYIEGTPFDSTGMELTLTYNNGATETITTGWQEEYDFSSPGQKTVTVTYGGKKTTLTVTVTAKQVTSIAIESKPNKTTYIEGQELDTTGLKLKASYNNGTEETVTGNWKISGYNKNKVGKQTITVTYGGKTTTFTVTVQAKSVSSVSMKSNPGKTTYFTGESLNLSGAKITVKYNNNTQEDMNVTSAMVSGYNPNKVGNQIITVTYQGKSATFTVTVNSRVLSSITSNTYTISGGYLSKISAGTTVSNLLNGINEKNYCKVFKGNTEVKGTALIGTGMLVKLMDGNTVKQSVTIVVTGDTNGDGGITITDMIAVKAHVLKKSTLSGAAAKAADTNGDNGISVTDFIQIKSHILGKSQIQAR